MYDLDGYGAMITDAIRTPAYAAALRAVVTPGCTVVDIGTGTGILALLACRLGAGRVHAIEPEPIIQVARDLAAANGMAGAIDFHQALSRDVSLPARADVVVSDLRGVLPLYGGHLSAIIDARERFLAPGGALVPRADRVMAALVEGEELHARVRKPWHDNDFGIDMSGAAELAANTWVKAEIREAQVLSEPALCASLDYASISSPDLHAQVELAACRAGTAHGFCLWFDTELVPGIGFSNAPAAPRVVYGQAFYRWPRGVRLAAGERVRLRLDARLIGDEYVWTWESRCEGAERASFRQSTFLGTPMTPESLHRKAEGHVPRLSQDGEIDRFVLERMAVGLPLGDIARELAATFPARFAGWREALRRVGDLSSRYSD